MSGDDEFKHILQMPRHEKRWFKDDLRRFLSAPIRAYRLEGDDDVRRSKIARMTEDRREALFALYDIPADWPEDIQWQWLALNLAGDWFPGCKTLARGLGGPSEEKRRENNKVKREIFPEFEEHKARKMTSDFATATHFLQANSKFRGPCHSVGITSAKGLAQAMRAIRKESGT